MTFKRFALTLVTVASIVFSVNAQKTIVDIAVGSKDHSTLVAALKAADLVSTLQGAGPFTVFAPTNAAFAKLPAGTVDNLLKAENKATLAKILTYHVIAGNFTAATVLKAIADAKGKLSLKTVSGANLLASLKDGKVILTDEKGGISTIVATDLAAGNGVIHVIDTVVLPN
ncbi:fasciclin domain-containing protein [Aquirufa ecclesiirivi]|uniref:Fasciclin domain-containing protein n=1 Tax=Aquirufa ecclesiirivi TaxID=2715124 RepID=A0ABT4JI19_9BACT|nr:fasciclin domain-containing protein [Aquirufa ecclesiirivi]MCZ2475911.1 fasciclin domain-containing protein [Aquirufa ecclesiirivi]